MSLVNNNRILFLWLNDKEFHSINAKRRGVETANAYKHISKFLKVFRRLYIMLGLFSISPWLGDWKKKIQEYNVIIVHSSLITSLIVRYISVKAPSVRIIVWYWNPVAKSEKLEKYPENICERWSFDEKDVQDYNLKYNTQYYFNDIKLDNNNILWDVYFVGGDKGRLAILLDLQKKLNEMGLVTNFHITKTSNNIVNDSIYKNRINYSQNIEFLSKSKAVLDIVSPGQTGLTLRPLEALFFNKKLITNDKTIIQRDFYDEKNIFVLGHDDFNNLNYFLNSPSKIISEEIKNKYDFDHWINRFFN